MAAKKDVSLADLNLTKQCEQSAEMEVKTVRGKGTGIVLSVLGAHAPEIQKWINKELNNRRREEALQAKLGKHASIRMIEEDIDFGMGVVAIRITGWRGISDQWSPENALLLCQTNAEIAAQVKEFSDDIANFTKG
jgi:hypothetical protein